MTTNPKIKGQVSLNGNKIGAVLNFELKNNKFQADLDASGLTELRFYEIQLTVSDASFSYSVIIFFFSGVLCYDNCFRLQRILE